MMIVEQPVMTGFHKDVSDHPALKFKLAWGTFVLLGVPTALVMSAGVSEQVALTVMVVLTLPCFYVLYRFFSRRRLRRAVGIHGGSVNIHVEGHVEHRIS
jgi:hypothetical protein